MSEEGDTKRVRSEIKSELGVVESSMPYHIQRDEEDTQLVGYGIEQREEEDTENQ